MNGTAKIDPKVLDVITHNPRVRIIYRAVDTAGNAEITERVVDINRIYTHEATGHRLMIGHCYRRNGVRTFNVECIQAAMPDSEVGIATFATQELVDAGRTVLPFTGQRTDSASRLAGWS